ncbi:ParB/RepB/Spo0J family partition protein [uncultured Pseudokineococcus sp.]|uniref:ParB/RepB/Spo0J family partition protein n=1 Tax=uncultured Pseudokineococcus sp. TaxID=1642928 RepID=UPI00262867D5|nr:ParB/RepB/Spo0J family partition protein [uncultured Pseudokineococcus sp.]
MTERRRGLGRGLGALIPTAPEGERPHDVFFPVARPATPVEDAGSTWNGSAAEPDSDAADRAAVPAAEDGAASGGVGAQDRSPRRAEGDDLVEVPGVRLAEIPVDAVRANPRQPRQVFDEDELAELEHSIREVGVLQPVVVRPVPSEDGSGPRYELVMGERRWRASQRAGLAVVPAIIRGTDDDVLLRDALLENLHRSQLNPLEEAAAYGQLLEDFGCTHDELARRIGRSRPQISNTLRLLKLPPLVQRRLAAGVLSAGHARALLGLPDAAAMERLAQRVVAEGLSVRSTEEAVATGEGVAKPRRRLSAAPRDERAEAVASALSERLETRVTISVGRRKGRMTVEFAGREDLERILGVLAVEGVSGADEGDAA